MHQGSFFTAYLPVNFPRTEKKMHQGSFFTAYLHVILVVIAPLPPLFSSNSLVSSISNTTTQGTIK